MSHEDASTQQLVLAAQAGDDRALETLFRRYLPRVAQMVAVHMGVPREHLPAKSEDIAQDAIIRALKGLPHFEVRGRGAFAAWLARIVENSIRAHHRKHNGVVERRLWQRYGDLDLSESLFSGGELSPSGMLQKEERNRAIESAMLELPVISRQVLSLRYFAGMSHAEIAHEIGHTEQNSRKLVQRALEALRAAIAKQAD